MNLLNQVLNISPVDNSLSEEEYKLVCDITKESGLPTPDPDGVVRSANDYFLTTYVVTYESRYAFVKLSPHDFLFKHDKTLSQSSYIPVVGQHIYQGEILNKFYYSVTWHEPSVFSGEIDKETLDKIITLFAGMLIVSQSQYPTEGLDNQEKVYGDIFKSYEFIDVLPKEALNKLTKKYSIDIKELLKEISEECHALFKENVLDKFPTKEGSLCFGPLKSDNVVISKATGIPYIITHPYIMKGNPIVEVACFPYYLGLNSSKFYREFSGSDKWKFKQLDKLSKFAWMVDFYLTLIDELMLSSLEVSFHNLGRLQNAAKYQSYRGRLCLHESLKKNLDKLDLIFLEKLL